MKLYEARSWGTRINEVEATRVTESSWFETDHRKKKEVRRALVTDYATYHETKEAAIEAMRRRFQRAVTSCQKALTNAETELAGFNAQYPEVSE